MAGGIKLAEVFAVFRGDLSGFKQDLAHGTAFAGKAGKEAEHAFSAGFKRGLDQSGQAVEELGQKLGKFTGIIKSPFAIGAVAVLAFAETMRESVKAMLEFEEGFERVELALHGTGQNVEELKGRVLSLSGQLGSTAQLSRALGAAVTEFGGISAEAAIEVVKVAGKFAALADTSPDRAMQFLADTMDAFNLSASDAGASAAKLIEVIRKGGGSFDELDQQFRNMAPSASALGLSFDDVAIALKVLGDAGVPAKKGIASLGVILAQVAGNAEAFRSIGIDVAGMIRGQGVAGLIQAIQQFGGDNAQERLKALGIAGRQFGVASKLAATDIAALQKAIEELAGVGAEKLDELLKDRAKGAAFAVKELGNEWTNLKTQFGEVIAIPLVPALKDITQLIRDARVAWEELEKLMGGGRGHGGQPGGFLPAADRVLSRTNKWALGGALVGLPFGGLPGAAVGAGAAATVGFTGALSDELAGRARAEEVVARVLKENIPVEAQRRGEMILSATAAVNAAKTDEARTAALAGLRKALDGAAGAEQRKAEATLGPKRPERDTQPGRERFALQEALSAATAERAARAADMGGKRAEALKAVELARLSVLLTIREAQLATERERAEFQGREVRGLEEVQALRRQTIEEQLQAELSGIDKVTAATRGATGARIAELQREIANRKLLQGYDTPEGQLEAKREVAQLEDRLAREREQQDLAEIERQKQRALAFSTAEKARADAAKQAESEIRKQQEEAVRLEDDAFKFRRAMGAATFAEELQRRVETINDERRSFSQRRQAAQEFYELLRGLRDTVFQAEVAMGQRSVQEEIDRNREIADDESRAMTDRIGAVQKMFDLEMRRAQDAFDLRKALNLTTTKDEIEAQVAIARASEQGSQRQVDALKKVAELSSQLRDEGRGIATGVLGVISDRLQKIGVDAKFATVSLASVSREFGKQQQKDEKVLGRFQSGGRVRLQDLQGALGRQGIQEQVGQALGGIAGSFGRATQAPAALFQQALGSGVRPENAEQGRIIGRARGSLGGVRGQVEGAMGALRGAFRAGQEGPLGELLMAPQERAADQVRRETQRQLEDTALAEGLPMPPPLAERPRFTLPGVPGAALPMAQFQAAFASKGPVADDVGGQLAGVREKYLGVFEDIAGAAESKLARVHEAFAQTNDAILVGATRIADQVETLLAERLEGDLARGPA